MNTQGCCFPWQIMTGSQESEKVDHVIEYAPDQCAHCQDYMVGKGQFIGTSNNL